MAGFRINGLVRIEDHPSHGKILVAVQAVAAGRTILTEPPLIIAPDNPWDWPAAFAAVSADRKEGILGLFSPVSGPNASRIRAALPTAEEVSMDPSKWSYLSHEGELLPWDAELYLKVIMAFHFNGVGEIKSILHNEAMRVVSHMCSIYTTISIDCLITVSSFQM